MVGRLKVIGRRRSAAHKRIFILGSCCERAGGHSTLCCEEGRVTKNCYDQGSAGAMLIASDFELFEGFRDSHSKASKKSSLSGGKSGPNAQSTEIGEGKECILQLGYQANRLRMIRHLSPCRE